MRARQEALREGLQALLARGPLVASAAAQPALDSIQRASIRLGAAEARRHRLLRAAAAGAGPRRRCAADSVPHRAQRHVRGPAHTTTPL